MAQVMFNARPDTNTYFMMMAEVASLRGTCPRRKVGCILINKHKHIIATGYNGVASGVPHCIDEDHRCPGAELPSGEGLDKCIAIHAEANALLQCKDTQDIQAIYSTAFPCSHCIKLLQNTSCTVIYYRDPYPGMEANIEAWVSSRHNRRCVPVHTDHGLHLQQLSCCVV